MMNPNMYKHEFDELIKKTKQELWLMRKFHREEEIIHYKNRLDSLVRLRELAKEARWGRI